MLDKLYITPRQWLRILRWTLYAALFLLSLLVQTVVFGSRTILGAHPDLVAIVITCVCLRENGVGASGNGKDAEGGAVVVMKVKTGEVLACASYPTYDLSTYNTNYNELAADPYKPVSYTHLTLPTICSV